MRVGLGLLAICTAFDILAYKLGEARPPIVGCYELAGFEVSRVAGRGLVMAPGDDIVAKGPCGWNIYMASCC